MTESKEKEKPIITFFECGPSKDHKCDILGPTVEIDGGESVSCSQCGMSAFERSLWDDD